MYLNPNVFPVERQSVEVFRIVDLGATAESCRKFGEASHGVDENELIWKFTGQKLLIATKYVSGTHEATTPIDFLPIIDELAKLHENGMVHGDIRVYNMVFSRASDGEKPDGCLIDFDYGGTEGEAKYPSGYVKTLLDGTRCGEAGQVITKENDWLDLATIIFQLHRLKKPVGKSPGDWANMVLDLVEKFDKDALELPGDAEELRKCLEDMYNDGWTLVPSRTFRAELEKKKSRATGSPGKKKALRVSPVTNLAGNKRIQSDT